MEKYSCNICGKEFKNLKSLGGHKSSHNRGNSYRLKRETENSKLRRSKSQGPHICKYCECIFDSGPKLGGHTVLCNMNPNRANTINKMSKANTGKSIPKDIKIKISESMKLAHYQGKAWNIGMNRWNNKPSYPESFFMKVIENEFIDKKYNREHPISIYSFDFAWIHKKKAIEIDGSQHDRFSEIKDRDLKKDALAKSKGWEVLRIKWVDMFNNPIKWIKIAYKFIH